MAGEWTETSLGAEVDFLTGFPFKSERYTDSDDSIRLVRGDNIVQGAMRWDGVKKWPSSETAEHELFQLREGDVVLAMDRPWIEAGLKYAAISKYDLPCLLVQRTARLRGGTKLDTGFLRYLIGSREFTQHIHAITTGTAVPHISGRQIKDFSFALPPLAEQKSIATVLEALDDKIELNRRMNATLEAMARALFQSWFVDFDPVRAKLDGRQPTGLDEATAALFPATVQDSPLGHIPQGWDVVFLDAISTVSSGKRPTERNDYLTPECNIPLYGGGGRMGYVSRPLYKKRILFTGRVGTLGLIFRVTDASWPSDNTLIIEPLDGFFDFTYFALQGFDLITLNRGSTQPLLTQTDLKRQQVVRPPENLVRVFTRVVSPIFEKIDTNAKQSRTLSTLRDTLLPKLLSGELGVASAEKIAGGSA